MRGARLVISMHIRRQRNIADGGHADEIRRHLLGVKLRRTERFHDLWAGIARLAGVQQARGREVAGQIREVGPPYRGFITHHERFKKDIRQSEAAVHEEHPPVDLRPDAIGDHPARFILVESVKDRATKERRGLRHAVADNLVDAPRDRVGGTFIVSRFVAKERDQVTRRGIADAKNQRILGRENHLIEQIGVEAVLQANPGRIRCSGKWRRRAIRPGPVAARNRRLRAVRAIRGLRDGARELRL